MSDNETRVCHRYLVTLVFFEARRYELRPRAQVILTEPQKFGPTGGNGIAWSNGHLFFSPNAAPLVARALKQKLDSGDLPQRG